MQIQMDLVCDSLCNWIVGQLIQRMQSSRGDTHIQEPISHWGRQRRMEKRPNSQHIRPQAINSTQLGNLDLQPPFRTTQSTSVKKSKRQDYKLGLTVREGAKCCHFKCQLSHEFQLVIRQFLEINKVNCVRQLVLWEPETTFINN